MSNNIEIQNKAIDKIHKIAKQSKMMVFILCDEDLGILDDGNGFTQNEKDEIFCSMNDALLEQYGEMLSDIVTEIQNRRSK